MKACVCNLEKWTKNHPCKSRDQKSSLKLFQYLQKGIKSFQQFSASVVITKMVCWLHRPLISKLLSDFPCPRWKIPPSLMFHSKFKLQLLFRNFVPSADSNSVSNPFPPPSPPLSPSQSRSRSCTRAEQSKFSDQDKREREKISRNLHNQQFLSRCINFFVWTGTFDDFFPFRRFLNRPKNLPRISINFLRC